MKTLHTLFLSLLIGSAMAQTQIPEGGFDNWTPNSTNIYYEPAGDWWTTLNSLALLGAPVTVYQTTDAHSGEFAAKLETVLWGDFLISGLLASGNFIMTEPYIENGRPFTESPSKFKGWYKYSPVNGDSAGVGALLTRYNTNTGQKDTVATAVRAITNSAETYTQFEIDFNYIIPGINPDTIIIVFTSSGDGGNFLGEVGSTLIIDEISLEYPSGIMESLSQEFTISAFPSPATDLVSFEFNTKHPKKLMCNVYAIDGRFMQSFSPSEKKHQLDVSTWQQGKYILQAYIDNSLVSSAKFVVVH
ncbi:MAG: PCMD domain-containing protein [Bacteroidetes bacterium]|nr:PCMD domain-containing protein [Bacteroidota bacterium]